MSETDDKLLIDAKAVARMYGCGVSTVWHWSEAKKIPAPVVARPKYTRWLKSQIVADIERMVSAERRELAS